LEFCAPRPHATPTSAKPHEGDLTQHVLTTQPMRRQHRSAGDASFPVDRWGAVPARAPLGELTSSTASGLADLRRALAAAGAVGIPVAPGTRFFFTSTSVRTLAPGCEFGAFSSAVPRGGALPVRQRSVGGIVFVPPRSTKFTCSASQTAPRLSSLRERWNSATTVADDATAVIARGIIRAQADCPVAQR
jgi:hypothetical protein